MKTRAMAWAILVGLSAMAGAQTLYAPSRSVNDQRLTLRGWGSGTIVETDEAAFEGTNSIRVSSRNYFQGGLMLFGQPVDLSGAFADKNNLLMLALRAPELLMAPAASGGGAGGGSRGGEEGGGGPSSGGFAGGAGGGSRGGGQGPTGAGAGSGGGGGTTTENRISKIRLIITTTDGKKSEAYVPVDTRRPDARGWVSVGLPLQAITGFDKTNRTVQSVAVASDVVSTFYIGEMKIQNDATPIYGEVNLTELNIGTDEIVTLTASGFGGASVLRYTWDFDATNGIQVDAEGQSIKRRFRKPGTYTVTVTISDKYNLKAPFKTTLKVTVN